MDVAVIEDHEDLRNLIVEHLASNGLNVIGFEDAETCLESSFSPSLYIIDINLPAIDGFELISRVRSVDTKSAIIVLSARGRPSDLSRGYDLGADIYLNKPVDPDVLLAAVLRMGNRQLENDSSAVLLERSTRTLQNGERRTELTQCESDFLLKLSLAGGTGLAYWASAELMQIDIDGEFQNVLEARIARLRKKLVGIGCDRSSLLAMRGVGYRLGVQLRVR